MEGLVTKGFSRTVKILSKNKYMKVSARHTDLATPFKCTLPWALAKVTLNKTFTFAL